MIWQLKRSILIQKASRSIGNEIALFWESNFAMVFGWVLVDPGSSPSGLVKPGSMVTVWQLSSIVGVLIWHNLLARGLLNCIHWCYGAIKERKSDDKLVLTTPLLT